MTLEDKTIYYCKMKADCLFFQKPQYHTSDEKKFYYDFCMHGGKNGEQECGLKRNYDRTNDLRKTMNFPRDKRTWRIK